MMKFNLYDDEVKKSKLSINELTKLRNDNYQFVATLLNNHAIINWPQGKTMLGLCQYGNFIIDDHDEDIGIMCEHYEHILNIIVPICTQNGFTVIRINKNKAMITLMRGPRYIDLCFFSNVNNTIGYENKWFPAIFYENFIQKQINDFVYNIPSKYKQICQYSYNIIIPDTINLITTEMLPNKKIYDFINTHQDRHYMYNILYPKLNNCTINENLLNIGFEWHNTYDYKFFNNVKYFCLDKYQNVQNVPYLILHDMITPINIIHKFKTIIDYGVIGWDCVNLNMSNENLTQYINNINLLLDINGLYCLKLDMKNTTKHDFIINLINKFCIITERFDIYINKIIKYKTFIYKKL